MADLFIAALLGHLIGDYLLQSNWMAITKSKNTWLGIVACSIHVLIYTSSVMLMLNVEDHSIRLTDFKLWFLIGFPHWLIDHWSLGEHWSKIIRGRTMKKTLAAQGVDREFAFAFYAPVYIAVDNTMHFLCLWALIKYMIV